MAYTLAGVRGNDQLTFTTQKGFDDIFWLILKSSTDAAKTPNVEGHITSAEFIY